MRVVHVRAPILIRLTAAMAVGVAVAASGCTISGEPPNSASTLPENQRAIVARIGLPVPPFSVATGEGYVWALTREPAPAVWRIDPSSNRVVGEPTRLPVDPWHIAVGVGSVWVTPNGADGRLLRINPRTGQISARISAHPIYFGSVLAVGAGSVWTGNDDERYQGGATVSKVDPRTNRVVGNPLVLGSPQSIAFGQGALWMADHAGWLVKIEPATFTVVTRQRLDFGAHGVVVTGDAVYVADAHGGRLLEADPKTAVIRRIVALTPGLSTRRSGLARSGRVLRLFGRTKRRGTTAWFASIPRRSPSPRRSMSAATPPRSPSALEACGGATDRSGGPHNARAPPLYSRTVRNPGRDEGDLAFFRARSPRRSWRPAAPASSYWLPEPQASSSGGRASARRSGAACRGWRPTPRPHPRWPRHRSGDRRQRSSRPLGWSVGRCGPRPRPRPRRSGGSHW